MTTEYGVDQYLFSIQLYKIRGMPKPNQHIHAGGKVEQVRFLGGNWPGRFGALAFIEQEFPEYAKKVGAFRQGGCRAEVLKLSVFIVARFFDAFEAGAPGRAAKPGLADKYQQGCKQNQYYYRDDNHE